MISNETSKLLDEDYKKNLRNKSMGIIKKMEIQRKQIKYFLLNLIFMR